MAPSDMNMEDDKKLDVILQRDQVIAKVRLGVVLIHKLLIGIHSH